MGFVIGTAGHIDHGKTALVKALTGQDTDRLALEKQRGISIDLGFAQLQLPGNLNASLIDVPGHERFIRNMVAGAHGIDLVLFTLAADDGVMPQTEEHFAIITSLGIKRAIFVITKMEGQTQSRLTEVKEELALLTEGSIFENSEILAVDSLSGLGIDTLKASIVKNLPEPRAPVRAEAFCLPIDRVFSITGRGVVVTGTVVSGSLQKGEEITAVPGGVYRVRGLQCHGFEVERGQKGDRLAINLTGAHVQDFHRGHVLCAAEIATSSTRFDVHFSGGGLKHGQRLRFHSGTAERLGTVFLFENSRAEQGFAQINLTEALHIRGGDHFVLRDAQAENTLAGGQVLDPIAPKISRKAPDRVAYLQALKNSDPIQALVLLLENNAVPGMKLAEVARRLNIPLKYARKQVTKEGGYVFFDLAAEIWIAPKNRLSRLEAKIASHLMNVHQRAPEASGLGLDGLHQQLAGATPKPLFKAILERAVKGGRLAQIGAMFAMPDHQPGLTDLLLDKAAAYLMALESQGFAPLPPDPQNTEEKHIIAALEQRGDLMRAASGLVFATTAFDEADQRLEVHLQEFGQITAAEFRDLLGTSRKYALALLESFDRSGRTVRLGDIRKAGRPLGHRRQKP